MSAQCSFFIDYKLIDGSVVPCGAKAVGLTEFRDPICLQCSISLSLPIFSYIPVAPLTVGKLTFEQFSESNKKRCTSKKPNGFGESLDPSGKYNAEHWALAVGEECGEVIGAVLGMTGRKERKKHLTKEDVFKEIGDVGACLDLLAQSLGSTLGECIRTKFNIVSDRIGSDIKL